MKEWCEVTLKHDNSIPEEVGHDSKLCNAEMTSHTMRSG